ncbi:HupE/UreJ family protein [Phenylobacterium sp. LjRoot225]|uniref:HupE/UreJ family protein n=1 Tax=Phenylobacterium sp. LjRoot225 TaxID=3342285 RepID=UPI003ECF26D5
MTRLLRLLTLAAAVLAATAAAAHVRSESHSVWEINGRNVDLVMTLPSLETARLSRGGQPSDADLSRYLAERVHPLADGRRCALVPPVHALGARAGYRRFDLTFTCPDVRNLAIRTQAFFEVAPGHLDYAQVQNAQTGAFTEQLITRDRQTVQVTGGEADRLKAAGFLDFVRMGVVHILTGVDHMAFLVGLVLISRRLKDLLFAVTGFTLGHSLTLALAVTGVIRPQADFIDALVAQTIALIGLENIAVQAKRPAAVAAGLAVTLAAMLALKLAGVGALPVLLLLGAGLFGANYLLISGQVHDAVRLRLAITLVFGLIHGFGFAAGLLDEPLPPERLAELLFGFNVGVEVGQLTIVAAVWVLAWSLGRLKVAPPRPIVVDSSAAALVGVGVFWFVTRAI